MWGQGEGAGDGQRGRGRGEADGNVQLMIMARPFPCPHNLPLPPQREQGPSHPKLVSQLNTTTPPSLPYQSAFKPASPTESPPPAGASPLSSPSSQNTPARIRTWVAQQLNITTPEQLARLPRLYVSGKLVDEATFVRVYKSVDALVIPTHGEGWGRPQMEVGRAFVACLMAVLLC